MSSPIRMSENEVIADELTQLSDRDLIARLAKGRDERAFAVLVSRHGPMVLRVCRRVLKNEHDAEDAFQAVFLVLARRLRQVRWHSCIGNWLYGVAYRIALQESRRMKKRPEHLLFQEEHSLSHAEQPRTRAGNLQSQEAERLLYQALSRLPNKLRAPLVLCHLEGRSRRQAAQELGVNESTVKGRLERGRELLRLKLAKQGLAVPAVLLSGELANEIAAAAISKALVLSTVHAATKFAAGYSAAGASVSAATGLAKGEIAKMLFATQVQWTVLTASAVAALGLGGAFVSRTSAEHSGPNAVTVSTAAASATDPPPGGAGAPAPANEPDGAAEQRPEQQINFAAVNAGLKRIAIAMHNYHDANGSFPAAASYDANQNKLLSWRVHILPYLGEGELYGQFRLTEPWDSDHNKRLIEKMPKIYAAGSAALQKNGKTMLLVPLGDNMAFGSRDPIRIRDITDGTSRTIMVVAVQPKYAVEWTRPEEWELNEKDPFERLTGKQGDGFIYVCCDGASHLGGDEWTVELLKAMLTRNGKELVEF